MVSLTDLKLRAARARVADVAASSFPVVPPALGSMILREDQRRTAARVAAALARDGGCLLADDVGRGKTYVALAVARAWHRRLFLVPASLKAMWADAMRRTGVDGTLVSHEALSRGHVPDFEADGIVVDESHRFRSPSSLRYAALTRIAAHTPVLLLSATPLQNGPHDLAAQIALFRGGGTFRLSPGDLARYLVRAAGDEESLFPALAPPVWIDTAADDGAVLQTILALPPPARPLDGGDGGVLRTISLIRAWASSRAALLAALRRRRQVAVALEQSLAEGSVPTRRELRSWQSVGADVQLGFASLLVKQRVGAADVSVLRAAVDAELSALATLQRMVETRDPDLARVAALRDVRAAHPNARVLAFSEFASTVRAYFREMRSDPGVGLLTARDARIASGRLPRDALLARFAPRAQGSAEPARRERVTLLLTTDLLSEGVNLQDANVVVHLDLPWNPMRLAQRIGRVRRPQGAPIVHGYLLAPPAPAEVLLSVEARLRGKLAQAEQVVGRMIDLVPALALDRSAMSPGARDARSRLANAAAVGDFQERVTAWRRPSGRGSRRKQILVAAARGRRHGWLAALDDGRLLASLDGREPDAFSSLPQMGVLAEQSGRPLQPDEAASVLREISAWLEREQVEHSCGVVASPSVIVATIERVIARIVRRAPRHERAARARIAATLREALQATRSLGAEQELLDLLRELPLSSIGDWRWLDEALAIAIRSGSRHSDEGLPRVAAVIVVGPARRESRHRRGAKRYLLERDPALRTTLTPNRCVTRASATPD